MLIALDLLDITEAQINTLDPTQKATAKSSRVIIVIHTHIIKLWTHMPQNIEELRQH